MWSCHYLSSSLSSSLVLSFIFPSLSSCLLCLILSISLPLFRSCLLSLSVSLTVSVSVCCCGGGGGCCGAVLCVWCCGVCVCAVRCVVCDTLKNPVCRFKVLVCTFNTSPCVPAPRAHMVYTCARSASIHGDVLNVHTATCWAHGGKERNVRRSLSASCFHR